MANNSNCSTDLSSDTILGEPEDAPEVTAQVVPQVRLWKRTCNLSIYERNALFYELVQWRKDGDSPVLKCGDIKAAFKKSLSAKKMNKKVLGQFMEYIA